MKTQKERMIQGEMYMPNDDELRLLNFKNRTLISEYNSTTVTQKSRRKEILKNLLGKTGESFHFEPPFHCDYGENIVIGENFYANFDCIMLDVAPITIGENVLLGPRVSFYTPGHPIDHEIRNSGLEFATAINVGNNVWIGGSTVINPGVTIGNNVVIGSGSVVTKDIPDNVVAAGVPCKVLREITASDTKYWKEKKKAYERDIEL
ncbi:sugar O-acetyltransferase [Enterococcus gilvus]|uniref:Acetyltransferase n=1 Tax=Enterococcus gilvus ATCC BAA-350 TaxID=1158614 RepID=R2VCP2_9ENTE|nr:sugar O-acetyltransferase [Enterococcus gilvus]EOI55455.1 hypothetical protein UKC_02663 [Enterococcus gilvus ATCC BAA-350]EOW82002.1 hypothetical protein I592_01303 [Enterococcus gilvus ATCC BAA-350]OJG43031.1 hypothetical protein RV02_GL002951 [Enterococcus gilvus]